MFENIVNFFKRVTKKDKNVITSNSKDTAKERLHLVLMQDRANVSADFLELMKQEIIDVIKKYIDVDESAIDVRLTNKENEDGTNGAPALYANIPIINIKNDMRKLDKKEENAKESTKKEEDKKEEQDKSEGKEEKQVTKNKKEKVEKQKDEKEKVVQNKEEVTNEEKDGENSNTVKEEKNKKDSKSVKQEQNDEVIIDNGNKKTKKESKVKQTTKT